MSPAASTTSPCSIDAQGRYEEAEPLYERALAISETALGPEHPDVATSLNNLAALHRAQGRLRGGGTALSTRPRDCGKGARTGSSHVGTSLNNLAALHRDQGRYEEAEPLYQRAVAILEKSLGADHPNTKMGRENYEGLKAEMAAKGDGKA